MLAGEVEQLGRAMAANTEAQARLHPDLVGPDALAVITTARRHGASGWKVNGAGGPGGSVALLASADRAAGARMLAAIEALDARFRIIPIALDANGLCTEGSTLAAHGCSGQGSGSGVGSRVGPANAPYLW